MTNSKLNLIQKIAYDQLDDCRRDVEQQEMGMTSMLLVPRSMTLVTAPVRRFMWKRIDRL